MWSRAWFSLTLEADHVGEDDETSLDLSGIEALESFQREILHREGRHGGPTDHRAPQRGEIRGVLLSQVAHEAPGEGVARPGRIEDRFQRIGRREKELRLGEEQR